MAIFSKHKITLTEILKQIPEESLTLLTTSTKVDYCSKVLSGKLMFYLLIYGMLRIDRLSQRGLRDAFSSPLFRAIFNYNGKKEISHSSISERLSHIKIDFFRHTYEIIYHRLSSLYTKKEISGMYLERVDSTLVLESCNKLKEGLTCGNAYGKKKMLKYTLNYDGMFSSFGEVHKESHYGDECQSLSENVIKHFKKDQNHSLVYLFDRGQCSANAFKEINNHVGLQFVGRLVENRKLNILEEKDIEDVEFNQGVLLKDYLAQLYRSDKKSHKPVLVEQTYRVIRFEAKNGGNNLLLITNIFHLPAQEIAQMYRKRWDIEVFFRFLKQELNFSHFLSLNDNGIQVILYMTLITAMLVMIYKKENELGYKTAVRRMGIELESLVLAIMVIQSGGDLKKTQLPDP